MNKKALKENTIKMYENTIKQMKENGGSQESIDAVKDAMNEYLSALKIEKKQEKLAKISQKNAKKSEKTELYREICEGISHSDVMFSNLFVVEINGIPNYVPCYLSNDIKKREIVIRFRELQQFSAFNYLKENKRIGDIVVKFLTNVGDVIREDKYQSVKLKHFNMEPLSHLSEEPLYTNAVFKYKKYGTTAC